MGCRIIKILIKSEILEIIAVRLISNDNKLITKQAIINKIKMSEKKREADRERIRLKRLNETPEQREKRLQYAREHKRTLAGKKVRNKQAAKRYARLVESS